MTCGNSGRAILKSAQCEFESHWGRQVRAFLGHLTAHVAVLHRVAGTIRGLHVRPTYLSRNLFAALMKASVDAQPGSCIPERGRGKSVRRNPSPSPRLLRYGRPGQQRGPSGGPLQRLRATDGRAPSLRRSAHEAAASECSAARPDGRNWFTVPVDRTLMRIRTVGRQMKV